MTDGDRLADLEHRLGMVEDVLAIRNLQHAYGSRTHRGCGRTPQRSRSTTATR
jgi:ribosomal protein S19E (S16A)